MRVRFNLSKGKNYMKWKVDKTFYGLDERLVLHNCVLKNNRKIAQRIFDGEHKSVCAWVNCDYVTIGHDFEPTEQLKYNPRVLPYWVYKGENADGRGFKTLFTIANRLYVCEPPGIL
jgi:hypothetical protein